MICGQPVLDSGDDAIDNRYNILRDITGDASCWEKYKSFTRVDFKN